jgi:hypothetical protein
MELIGGVAGGAPQTFRTVTAELRGRAPGAEQSLLASDVLTLTGTQTDSFVVRFSYDEATAIALLSGETNVWPGWFDPTAQQWEGACVGNVGGTWAFAGNRPYEAGSDFHLGTYGIDTTNNQVWAVVNHGGAFAVMANSPRVVADQWRQAWFGTAQNSDAAADTADPDGDGQANLLERAFGTNPTVSQAGAIAITGGVIIPGSPTTMMAQTESGVDFRALFGRRKDYIAAGFTYTVQFSADLGTWASSTSKPTVVADDGVMQAVTVPYPFFVNGRKARFFRVSVTEQ